MSIKTRLLKLETRFKPTSPAQIFVIYQEGDQVTHNGRKMTRAEWDIWHAANGSENDTVLIIVYDDDKQDDAEI
jgi:carotenoid cleavage dioxygenase-like enzyme